MEKALLQAKISQAFENLLGHANEDLKAALRAWKSWLSDERNASPLTVYNYIQDLKTFSGFLINHLADNTLSLESLIQLTARDFRSFLAYRQQSDKKILAHQMRAPYQYYVISIVFLNVVIN